MPEEIDPHETAGEAAQKLATRAKSQPVVELVKSDLFVGEIEKLLPTLVKPQHFVRVALTAMYKQPKLTACTHLSIFNALLDLASFGLEADGRHAHLVPYEDKRNHRYLCQLILDYKGLVTLVRRAGDVRHIHADVVYQNDGWIFSYGSNRVLKHTPDFGHRNRAAGDQAIAFYDFVVLRDGTEEFMVMSNDEVEAIHQRSKAKDKGPWVTDYDEMGKKTVFKRHCKWLELSSEVRRAIDRDEDAIDVAGERGEGEAAPRRSRSLGEELAAKAARPAELIEDSLERELATEEQS